MTMKIALLLLPVTLVLSTQELNQKTFDELTSSGKNGMIKFFQPWCGHCTRMKPDWDKLADEAHQSVFIADVNCSDEEELCTKSGVQGYPTIKVYKDGKVEDYRGGRGFEELFDFVDSNLASKCDVKQKETCSEKAIAYVDKWTAKDAAAIEKEIGRLKGMVGKSMTQDLKIWLRERLTILEQLASSGAEEL